MDFQNVPKFTKHKGTSINHNEKLFCLQQAERRPLCAIVKWMKKILHSLD